MFVCMCVCVTYYTVISEVKYVFSPVNNAFQFASIIHWISLVILSLFFTEVRLHSLFLTLYSPFSPSFSLSLILSKCNHFGRLSYS